MQRGSVWVLCLMRRSMPFEMFLLGFSLVLAQAFRPCQSCVSFSGDPETEAEKIFSGYGHIWGENSGEISWKSPESLVEV